MSLTIPTILTGLVVLLVGGALAAAALRLRAQLEGALKRAQAAEQELGSLGRREAAARQERDFLARFVRDYQHLTRNLHTTVRQRDIAQSIVTLAARTFDTTRAAVLLRRRRPLGDAEASAPLVVAAVTEDAPIRLGTELPDSRGELGLAVEHKTLVSRRDLLSGLIAATPAVAAQGGFGFDLVAPILFGEETLGAICVSNPNRESEEARAALRLIAQAGAQALQSSAAFQQIKTTANLDGLTGVFNKRHMTVTLGERLVDAERRHARLSIFLFDVDNFKHYNDTNGHGAGDELLKQLARLVQEHVRPEDVFGRFGGEEFLLVLPDTPLAGGLFVAHKVCKLIASHAFQGAASQPLGCVSVSGGVAEYPDDALDSTRLLRSADEALYAAKRAGRNRVHAVERRFLGGPPLEPAVEQPEKVADHV